MQIYFIAACGRVNQPSRNSLKARLCVYLRICVVYTDTVSIKSITKCCGVRLAEYAGRRSVRCAAGVLHPLYSEWSHRKGGCLACLRLQGRFLAALIYTAARGAQGVLPMSVGGATSQLDLVSDAIVRSWLWSTATRSSPLGYFSIFDRILIQYALCTVCCLRSGEKLKKTRRKLFLK